MLSPLSAPKPDPSSIHSIVTPYHPDEWDRILEECNLSSQFPDLASKLRHGFSIGTPQPPEETTIFPNLIRHPEDLSVIQNYLDKETLLNHMSGPFTKEEMDEAMEGETWVCSPVFVVRTAGEEEGGPDKTRVVINLSKKGKGKSSVNDHLECIDTQWGTASKTAEIVSVHILYLYIIFVLSSLHFRA